MWIQKNMGYFKAPVHGGSRLKCHHGTIDLNVTIRSSFFFFFLKTILLDQYYYNAGYINLNIDGNSCNPIK